MHEFWATLVFSFPKKHASQGSTVLELVTDYPSCTDTFMLFTEQGMSTYFAFLAGEGEEFLMFFILSEHLKNYKELWEQ